MEQSCFQESSFWVNIWICGSPRVQLNFLTGLILCEAQECFPYGFSISYLVVLYHPALSNPLQLKNKAKKTKLDHIVYCIVKTQVVFRSALKNASYICTHLMNIYYFQFTYKFSLYEIN